MGGIKCTTSSVRKSSGTHLRATIKSTSILFELDLGADGVYDAQRTIAVSYQGDIGYSVLRLGGPSDVSSVGGLAFDNVSIVQVPEPTTMALLGVGSLLLGYRRN